MFNKDQERTPVQQATRARLSVFARIAAAIYLITIIYKIWTADDRGTAGAVIAIVMLLADLFLLAVSVREGIRRFKNGEFREEFYYTEEYLEKVHQEQLEYAREHPDEAADMDIDLSELEEKSDTEDEE